MAPLPRIDDRWVWLGFGILFFAAAKGIQYALRDIVRLTEVERIPKPEKKAEDLPENNISLDYLRTLADSPNPNISNAAIAIIVERFKRRPDALASISHDLSQPHDEDLRERAQRLLTFVYAPGNNHGYDRTIPAPALPVSGPRSPPMPELEEFEELPLMHPDGAVDEYPNGATTVARFLFPRPEGANDGSTPLDEGQVGGEAGEAARRRQRREVMVWGESEEGVAEDEMMAPAL